MNIVSEARHLQLVVALEDEGSLHAAARRLHVSPSALSQQLRELEQRLGGALFHRAWRKLSPTPAGRRFTDGARALLRELARVEAETRHLHAAGQAALRLATVCQQSYRWLPPLLERFAKQHPEVEVTVVPEAAEAPAHWLEERKLDLALVAGELGDSTRIAIEPIFRDELVAVVGSRHAWFRRRSVDVSEFAHEHLLVDDGALARRAPLRRALTAAGDVTPRKLTLLPMTGSVAADMARANLGITLLPLWTLESLHDPKLAAVRIGKRGLWLDWSIATRREPPEPALAAFVQALRERHPRAQRPKRSTLSQ